MGPDKGSLLLKQLTARQTIWQVKSGYPNWTGSKPWTARVGVLPYLGWETANNRVKGVATEGPAGENQSLESELGALRHEVLAVFAAVGAPPDLGKF